MVLMASTRGLGPCSLGSSPNAPTRNKLKEMFFVYILQNKFGKIYIGQTRK